MPISSAPSKILFHQSTIFCTALRIQMLHTIGYFQILTSRLNRPRSLKIYYTAIHSSPNHPFNLHCRFQRRDIKAEIDIHLFCHIEATVPTLHNLLWRMANSNLQHHQPLPNHHIEIKLALLPKITVPHTSTHPQINVYH